MAIWQFCTLLISTAIYWPFAKKYDKVLLAKEQKEAKEAKESRSKFGLNNQKKRCC